jgi:methylthioribose-1-phosphate isomerase
MSEKNFVKVIEWHEDHVVAIDQRKLPHEESYLELYNYREVAQAIKDMAIRGAPAIGIATAYGIALGGLQIDKADKEDFLKELDLVITVFTSTRPTAQNLFRVMEDMRQAAISADKVEDIKKRLVDRAKRVHQEEQESEIRISQLGATLIPQNMRVLTHCNTGSLATAAFGTALGIIKQAYREGKLKEVIITETRPLFQGSRLTAWELKREDIPFTLITDMAAGFWISQGKVDAVIVGADRIALNGDTANKIGTYTLAVLAKEKGIPFYIAAPSSTIDQKCRSGKDIPIEFRDPGEVTHIYNLAIAPEGTLAANPAFDITPHQYITAIINENGIFKGPFYETGFES